MSVTTQTGRQAGRRVPSWFIYLFGALGAILWGYDTGVVSGALLYIKRDFTVSAVEQGLITSSFTMGAIVGALVTALLVDRLGRKRLLFLAAIVFVIGTLLAALATGPAGLIAGRAVLGIGIGFVAVNIPIYLSEIAPARSRGRVVSLTQFMNASGILLAYVFNYVFSATAAWRWMIGVAVLPAILLLVGVLVLPDSPRWLVARGRFDEARAGLAARGDDVDPEVTVREIRDSLAVSHGAWRSMLRPWARKPVLIAILMTVLAQFLGINAITYYAPTVLTTIGFSDSSSLITTIGFGTVSVLATVWAVRYADRFRRRRILATGAVITGGAMLITAVFTWTAGMTSMITGVVAIAAFTAFKAGFSSTWGPVSRVVETEILPISIRGTAVSVAEMANFAAIFVVTLLFPILLQGGAGFAFIFFAAMAIVAIAILIFLVPETRGRSLEEIEISLRSQHSDESPTDNRSPFEESRER